MPLTILYLHTCIPCALKALPHSLCQAIFHYNSAQVSLYHGTFFCNTRMCSFLKSVEICVIACATFCWNHLSAWLPIDILRAL